MSRTPRALHPRALTLSTVAAAALVLPACMGSSTPAEAQASRSSTVQSISARDKQEGAKAHPELLAEFGGVVPGPQARYVETVGKTIAVQSGLSNARDDFTVSLLNSSVNNAFAIPGGYVYVTRQLVALMNNEAELAGVLGHEVGHVAARHSAKRQKAATRNSIIGVLGSVLSGVLLGDSSFGRLGQQVFSQGSQLLTLQYSRGQELEADNLGIDYLRRARYDPRAMSSVLQSLAAQNALEARLQGSSSNRVPEWASTHPDPASRVRAALTRAGANATGMTNQAAFFASLDGLIYGDDPQQGIVDGRVFTHPVLRFRFEVPTGFYMVNGSRAVSISGQSGKAQFTGGAYNGNLDTYIRQAFASLTDSGQAQIAPQSIQRTTVNGVNAAYGTARVNNGQGQVDVVVFAYEFSNNQAFHFTTITQAGQSSQFNRMFSSMRRLTQAEAGSVRPRRVDVVTVGPRDTVRTMASRMAYTDAPLERFLVLNGLSSNAQLRSGQQVKIVTY